MKVTLSSADAHGSAGRKGAVFRRAALAFCLCVHSWGGGGRADETLAQDCNQLLQPKKTNRFEQGERNGQKGEVEKK
ncbi:hypothetical protein ROHU_029349 [Labeo rohita]|uniref:Uncharacterized protein n=1 Tax=Labeo rohita TaxID=84645 RepID=A0A498LM35_LABRO|nr:hypothetical protein ROHU_031733 [Labeo rohita]RXN12896.1 hypothetical protein ROHU_029349 [Labeo rohita]